jgi:hypothetical protein
MLERCTSGDSLIHLVCGESTPEPPALRLRTSYFAPAALQSSHNSHFYIKLLLRARAYSNCSALTSCAATIARNTVMLLSKSTGAAIKAYERPDTLASGESTAPSRSRALSFFDTAIILTDCIIRLYHFSDLVLNMSLVGLGGHVEWNRIGISRLMTPVPRLTRHPI